MKQVLNNNVEPQRRRENTKMLIVNPTFGRDWELLKANFLSNENIAFGWTVVKIRLLEIKRTCFFWRHPRFDSQSVRFFEMKIKIKEMWKCQADLRSKQEYFYIVFFFYLYFIILIFCRDVWNWLSVSFRIFLRRPKYTPRLLSCIIRIQTMANFWKKRLSAF